MVCTTPAAPGSSPRVRGTRADVPIPYMRSGIIPACAGNTFNRVWSCARFWDHPRVCGEHDLLVEVDGVLAGSSPRVRGTPAMRWLALPWLWIIPACAGNTYTPFIESKDRWDHPRVCGEHGESLTSELCPKGSSPRVRGTPTRVPAENGWDGIIPACAGNTETWQKPPFRAQDHPRVCGEHSASASSTCRGTGSSPRVRGTRVRVVVARGARGIIPACAGNTRPRWRGAPRGRDHPRVCGEHVPASVEKGCFGGSSPRVRGTLVTSTS